MESKIVSRTYGTLAAALVLWGCAGMAPRSTDEKISKADAAVTIARQGDSAQYAPLEYQLAQEDLDNARKASQKKDYRHAEQLADRALADAQLALAKAQAETARKATQDLRASIDTLKRELNQPAPTGSATQNPSSPGMTQ